MAKFGSIGLTEALTRGAALTAFSSIRCPFLPSFWSFVIAWVSNFEGGVRHGLSGG